MPILTSTGFNKTIFFILLVGTILAIGLSYYKFYVEKDYPFLVEAPCDILYDESCSERDCDIDGCPANGLSVYKTYEINASDFVKCSDDTCDFECRNEIIQCKVMVEE